MRLLIVSIEFPPGPGGLGTLAYQAALHLSEMGWEVEVQTPQDHTDPIRRDPFNAEQPFEVRPICHVEPPIREGLRRLWVALRSIRARRPDVLFAVGRQAVWLGAVLSLLTGVPLVAVSAGSEFAVRSRLGRRLNQWAYGRTRHTLVISRYTQQLAAAAGVGGGLGAGNTTVVRCGADERRFRPGLDAGGLRERLGLVGRQVLLTVGQLSERKAQDVIIRALPALLQAHPELIYVMAGLPTRGRELEELAKKLGVREHVLFAGAVPTDELPLYYNLADVFVLVSRRTQDGQVEGYGIVVAEAALCGVPAVVSRGCGLEEAVIEGQTALLVEPDDPHATAEAIQLLLSDDALRKEMGSAARSHVLESGTWSERVAVYDRILRRVSGER